MLLLSLLLINFLPIIQAHTISISGNNLQFSNTYKVSLSIPFDLYWNASSDGSVNFAVVATPSVKGGWIGVGFNKDLVMVPSVAVIAIPNSPDSNNSLLQYALNGKDSSQVIPSPSISFINPLFENSSNGEVKFSFSIPSGNNVFLRNNSTNAGLLFAYGPPSDSPTSLKQHQEYATASISLDGSGDVSDSSNNRRKIMVIVHAALMILIWQLLVPLAAMIANINIRQKLFPNDIKSNPRYTGAHTKLISVLGILFLVAIILAIVFIGTRTHIAHFAVAIVLKVLFVLQSVMGRLRRAIIPTSEQKNAFMTFIKNHKQSLIFMHSILGRFMWILATVNIYLGLKIYSLFGKYSFAIWGILIAVGLAIILVGPIFGPRLNKSRNNEGDQ